MTTQITKFMGPTWGPLKGPMLAPWTLISGNPLTLRNYYVCNIFPVLANQRPYWWRPCSTQDKMFPMNLEFRLMFSLGPCLIPMIVDSVYPGKYWLCGTGCVCSDDSLLKHTQTLPGFLACLHQSYRENSRDISTKDYVIPSVFVWFDSDITTWYIW